MSDGKGALTRFRRKPLKPGNVVGRAHPRQLDLWIAERVACHASAAAEEDMVAISDDAGASGDAVVMAEAVELMDVAPEPLLPGGLVNVAAEDTPDDACVVTPCEDDDVTSPAVPLEDPPAEKPPGTHVHPVQHTSTPSARVLM